MDQDTMWIYIFLHALRAIGGPEPSKPCTLEASEGLFVTGRGSWEGRPPHVLTTCYAQLPEEVMIFEHS
eukprot:scaffold75221_cov83-Attheya_sp.AAC.1